MYEKSTRAASVFLTTRAAHRVQADAGIGRGCLRAERMLSKEGTVKGEEYTRPFQHNPGGNRLLSSVLAHCKGSWGFVKYRNAGRVGYKQKDEKEFPRENGCSNQTFLIFLHRSESYQAAKTQAVYTGLAHHFSWIPMGARIGVCSEHPFTVELPDCDSPPWFSSW